MARRRPRGVVGLITPWNFPLAIPAWKLAPALAYGNACVWKPSPFAPACAEALHGLPRAPSCPTGVVQLVQGRGDAGAALVGHPGVAAISFTGSVATGRAVARMAVERGAAVAMRDGRPERLDRARRRRPRGRRGDDRDGAAMGYAGQKCTATSRVICDGAVPRPMRDALVAAVDAACASRIPADEACRVGPLISAEARDAGRRGGRRAAVEAGGRLLAGGGALDAPGNYLAPALVEVDDPAAELAQEEVFAPVCARHARRTAPTPRVELANGVRHGLVTVGLHARPRPRARPGRTGSTPASCASTSRPPASTCTRRSAARRPRAWARASRARPRASSTPACARCSISPSC